MREVYSGSDEFDWEEWTTLGVARWGITDFATLSVEASRNLVSFDGGQFESPDYSYWVGGAIQAALWRDEQFTVSGAFQFTSAMFRFNDGQPRNVTSNTTGGQIIAQHEAKLWNTKTSYWGGPAYSLFYPTYLPEVGTSRGRTELYTKNETGAACSASASCSGVTSM